jgi:hypothetical protein
MNRRYSTASLTFCGIAGLALSAAAPVWAAPLAGEALKFQQLPLGDLATNPNSVFPGHDEPSTAMLNATGSAYTGTFAADDFSDNVSSPVVDVQWWGSYLPNGATSNQVPEFLISFESNIPSGPNGNFSQPGQPLSVQSVVPGALAPLSGTFTQTPEPAIVGPDGPLYEYNAELKNPFPEVAGTTYWLKIVALTTPNDPVQWGWHNRDYTIPDPFAAPPGDALVGVNAANQPVYHYLDDAVSGNVTYIPGASANGLIETDFAPLSYNTTTDGFAAGAVTPSEDLAFSLYYNVPEPFGLPLLAAGMFFLRRQRRNA